MTCTAMLDRMLEAELHELSAQGDSPLAAHLRECGSCRTMARRIVSDTSVLATAVAPRPSMVLASRPRSTGLRRRVAIGLAAAAVLVVIARRWSSPIEPPETPPARYANVTTPTPAAAPMPEATDRTQPSAPNHAGRAATTTPRGSEPLGRARRETRTTQVTPALAVTAVTAVTSAPVIVAAVEPPVAVAPVRIDAPPRDPLGSGVAVHPPAGTRADILRTADPSVTVVWLYR